MPTTTTHLGPKGSPLTFAETNVAIDDLDLTPAELEARGSEGGDDLAGND